VAADVTGAGKTTSHILGDNLRAPPEIPARARDYAAVATAQRKAAAILVDW
jgi:hypothetical protein